MVLGQPVSRFAHLRGKHKLPSPTRRPCHHQRRQGGAAGKKLDQKIYYHHTGYPGGLKKTPYRLLMEKKPEFAVKHAIVGMLPKGPLGRKMATKLRIYAGAEHEHQAQQPEVLKLS